MPEPTVTDTGRYYPHAPWASPEKRVLMRLEQGGTEGVVIPGRGRHAIAVEIDPGDYQGRHRAAEVAAA